MLYYLFKYLQTELGFHLGVFITFRLAAAFFTSWLILVVFGRSFIARMQSRGLCESFESLGVDRRRIVAEQKEGTPTMGGVLIGLAIFGSALLWCRLDEPLVLCGLFVFAGCWSIGLRDDWVKRFDRQRHGISTRTKLLLLGLVALGAGLFLMHVAWAEQRERFLVLLLPFLKNANLPLLGMMGLPFLLLVVLTVSGSANAVNLADGMDGLAAGCLCIAGVALTALCYVAGHAKFATYLYVLWVPGSGEVAILLGALVGATLGFLWFNTSPAQIFMGDVGSLSLGGLLGYAAVASRMELSLIVVGGVFVAEALSVLIQVGSYKLRRKRVFLCAPIHHHFQKLEVPETKIVARFWIVSILLAVLSVTMFKVR
ncbi:MAG: phospho-N-acetylmuramoyl-pentapeptide-transferase [Planctomycetota bacterium]